LTSKNVPPKVTKATWFVIRYGIQADIQVDIQDGFFGLFELRLPNAAHSLWVGSDII
jgi:hypothetical protein